MGSVGLGASSDRSQFYRGSVRAMMLIWGSILVFGIVFFAIVGLTHG